MECFRAYEMSYLIEGLLPAALLAVFAWLGFQQRRPVKGRKRGFAARLSSWCARFTAHYALPNTGLGCGQGTWRR